MLLHFFFYLNYFKTKYKLRENSATFFKYLINKYLNKIFYNNNLNYYKN